MGTKQFDEINPVIHSVAYCNIGRYEKIENKCSCTHRILLMQHGIFRFCTQDKDFTLKAGDLLYFPSGKTYLTEMDNHVQLINIFFDFYESGNSNVAIPFLYLHEYRKELASEPVAFSDTTLFASPFKLSATPSMKESFEMIIKEEQERRTAYRLRQKALLTDLLIKLYRNDIAGNAPKASHITDEILSYIVNHTESRLDRESLSSIFHYHPNSINKMVTAATGMTLHQYILDTKIRRSMELLSQTEMTVTEIASQLCFCDSSHFASVFYRSTGYTPAEYRSKSRQL